MCVLSWRLVQLTYPTLHELQPTMYTTYRELQFMWLLILYVNWPLLELNKSWGLAYLHILHLTPLHLKNPDLIEVSCMFHNHLGFQEPYLYTLCHKAL